MTLQQEATNLISDLPDDSIRFIIEMIQRMKNPITVQKKTNALVFGIAEGKFAIPDAFDEWDAEIADLFEGAE